MAGFFLSEPYKFRTKQPITFEVSVLASDYGVFTTKSEAEHLARSYLVYCKAWLLKHGYMSTIKLVRGYSDESTKDYGYIPSEQRVLREQIWRDFSSPLNWGQPMNVWQGLVD